MIRLVKSKVKIIIYIFFISIIIIFTNFVNNSKTRNLNQNSNNVNIEISNSSNQINSVNEINANEYQWQIEIPVISLKAEIQEGTEKQVMDKYVGHFTETSITDGNVALIAHNRGYAVNYFANLKDLNKEDEIIYKYKDYKKVYKVEDIKLIKDTDFSCIENTKENVITLITCVENQPEYRRCIRAIERK